MDVTAVHATVRPRQTPHESTVRAAAHPMPQPQGYLGIDVRGVTEEDMQQYRLRDTRGAVILRVDHDGPAGKMGLRERDVILQMNAVVIEGEEQLRRMLRDMAPGRPVQMVINRDGQLLTLQSQMANRTEVDRQAWAQHLNAPPPPAPILNEPASGPAAPSSASRYSRFLGSLLTSPTYTGAALETMSPQLAQFFGVPSNSGLLVRSVAPNSPAALAGIHAGDVVLRANSHGILSMAAWARVIKESKGQPVIVVVLRDRTEHTLTMVPDFKHHSSLQHTGEPVAQAAPPSL